MDIIKIIKENDYDLYKSHSIIYSLKKKEMTSDLIYFKHFNTALVSLLISVCYESKASSIEQFEIYFSKNKNIMDNMIKFKEILRNPTVIESTIIPVLRQIDPFIQCFGKYVFHNDQVVELFIWSYYSGLTYGGYGDLEIFKFILRSNTSVFKKITELKNLELIKSRYLSKQLSLLSILQDDNLACFNVMFSDHFDIKENNREWNITEFYNLWKMVCKYDSYEIASFILDYFIQGLVNQNENVQKACKTINPVRLLTLAIGGISINVLSVLVEYLPKENYRNIKFGSALSFENLIINDYVEGTGGDNQVMYLKEIEMRNRFLQLITKNSIILVNEIDTYEQKELSHFCFFRGDVEVIKKPQKTLVVQAMESKDQNSLHALLLNFKMANGGTLRIENILDYDQLLRMVFSLPESVITVLKCLQPGVQRIQCQYVEPSKFVPLIFFSLNSFELFQYMCSIHSPNVSGNADIQSLWEIRVKYHHIFDAEKFNQFFESCNKSTISINQFIKFMCDDPDKFLKSLTLHQLKKSNGCEILFFGIKNKGQSAEVFKTLFKEQIQTQLIEQTKAEEDLLKDLENEEKLKKQKEKDKKQKQKQKQKIIDQKNKPNNKQQQQQQQQDQEKLQEKETDDIKQLQLQLQQQQLLQDKEKQQEIEDFEQKELIQKQQQQQVLQVKQEPKINNSTTTTTNNNNKSTPKPTGNSKKKQQEEIIKIDKSDKSYFEIGKFQFIRNESNIVGRGSNGTLVFKGIWSNKVPVAIKQMQKAFCNGNQITKEIDALITMTSKNCSNMIRYIDKEEDELFVYLGLTLCNGSLQELIEKGALQQFINSSKSGNVLKLFGDIINGVQFLHSNDMVHNDLNPRNILCHDGSFIISDLGLSKMEVEVSFSYTHNNGAVPTGQGGFHPAEVLEDKRKTKSVDIFSLGCILFVMLTNGQHPFGSKLYRIVNILMNKPDLSELQHNLFACDLIKSMISKDESKRPLIQQVSSHPLFWSNDYKIKFIDTILNLNKEQQNYNLKRLLNNDENNKPFLKTAWNLMIDEILLPTDELPSPLIKKATYQYDLVYDLIRFIRNTIQHHKDISKFIQQQKSESSEILVHLTNPESVLLYFESKIPHLIYHLYQQLKYFPNNSDYLNSFFTSSKK